MNKKKSLTSNHPGPEIAIARTKPALNPTTVLVLKLDHRGDFDMAKPALEWLRSRLPDSEITLVVGHWNEKPANQMNIANKVVVFDFFAENPSLAGARATQREQLKALSETGLLQKFYDVVVDLRVDFDTRWLLAHFNCAVRSGFGSFSDFPFLTVNLPLYNPSILNRYFNRFIAAAELQAAPVLVHQLHKISGLRRVSLGNRGPRTLLRTARAVVRTFRRKRLPELLIFGPYIDLPPGHYSLGVFSKSDRIIPPEIVLRVVSSLGTQTHAVGATKLRSGLSEPFFFSLPTDTKVVEFYLEGRPADLLRTEIYGYRLVKTGSHSGPHQTQLMRLLMFHTVESLGMPIEVTVID